MSLLVKSPETAEGKQAPKVLRKRRDRYMFSLFLLLVLGFIALAFTTGLIPSSSMEPGLIPGDHILIERTWAAYPFGVLPQRGDIITFRFTKGAQKRSDISANTPVEDKPAKDQILIKRVIGLPGDTVQIKGNDLYINGRRIKETYPISRIPANALPLDTPYATLTPLKIDRGRLFVLGDNRGNSDDGRFWGTLAITDVTGKYIRTLYHTNPPSAQQIQKRSGN